VKVDGTWRYCKAAFHDNDKINPDIVFAHVKQALLEKHAEGLYCAKNTGAPLVAGTIAQAAAAEKYFANCGPLCGA
jgi:hypothetical protein